MPPRQTAVRRPSVVARRRRWKLLLLAVALAVAAYLLLTGDAGLLRLWGRQQQLEEIEATVARLEAENDSLRQVLWRLENDLDYVEKVAREEYGMSKKGERVYRLRPPEEEREE